MLAGWLPALLAGQDLLPRSPWLPTLDLELGPPGKKTKKTKKTKNTNWNCKNIVFYKGFHFWNLKKQRKAETFLQNHILTKKNTNWNCKNAVEHSESAFPISVFV